MYEAVRKNFDREIAFFCALHIKTEISSANIARQKTSGGDSLGAVPRSFQQQQHNRGC